METFGVCRNLNEKDAQSCAVCIRGGRSGASTFPKTYGTTWRTFVLEVLTESRYQEWKAAADILDWKILLEMRTSYYGFRFRTRAGALIITPTDLIHWAYSAAWTPYGRWEDPIKVVIPLAEIESIAPFGIGLVWRIFFMLPQVAVRLSMRDGASHELIFHSGYVDFTKAMKSLGVASSD